LQKPKAKFFESENVVELSDSLLKFLKENLLNHASEKSIKDKILEPHPVPAWPANIPAPTKRIYLSKT